MRMRCAKSDVDCNKCKSFILCPIYKAANLLWRWAPQMDIGPQRPQIVMLSDSPFPVTGIATPRASYPEWYAKYRFERPY